MAAVCLLKLITMFPAGIVVNVIEAVPLENVWLARALFPFLSIVISGGADPPIEKEVPQGTSISSLLVQ